MLPAQGVTLSTPEVPSPPPGPGRPRIVVSRERGHRPLHGPDGRSRSRWARPGQGAAVVQGRADVYVHAGGQFEWDSAAPVAVARAAGLHTSRIDGTRCCTTVRTPTLPDLVVCRARDAAAVLAAIR